MLFLGVFFIFKPFKLDKGSRVSRDFFCNSCDQSATMLIFIQDGMKAKPIWGQCGSLVNGGEEEWECDKYDLSQLSNKQLWRILYEGGLSVRKSTCKSDLIEYIYKSWKNIREHHDNAARARAGNQNDARGVALPLAFSPSSRVSSSQPEAPVAQATEDGEEEQAGEEQAGEEQAEEEAPTEDVEVDIPEDELHPSDPAPRPMTRMYPIQIFADGTGNLLFTGDYDIYNTVKQTLDDLLCVMGFASEEQHHSLKNKDKQTMAPERHLIHPDHDYAGGIPLNFYLATAGLAGGGKTRKDLKTKAKKDGAVLKGGMLAELRECVAELKARQNSETYDTAKETIAKAQTMMNAFEAIAKDDAEKAMRIWLGKLDDQTIGENVETSPLALTLQSNNKADLRIGGFVEMTVKQVFREVKELFDEISGMVETGELILEHTVVKAYYTSGGTWNWSGIKASIKAEIARRHQADSEMDELTRTMDDMEL
eukprot:s706_g24.t1